MGHLNVKRTMGPREQGQFFPVTQQGQHRFCRVRLNWHLSMELGLSQVTGSQPAPWLITSPDSGVKAHPSPRIFPLQTEQVRKPKKYTHPSTGLRRREPHTIMEAEFSQPL